ncbi:hypothetical protein PYV50_09550 [Pseudomonas sp. H22_DOA]|nr:hypothetical protein PYV50_09550 [Pseudomonas sp. H22_DOA]
MTKRLLLSMVTVTVLLSLTGCATYRAVAQKGTDKKDVYWLLPPSAEIETSVLLGDSTPSSWFHIDLPLQKSTCLYFSRLPWAQPHQGGLQGEIVPTLSGTVLRMKSKGSFLEEVSLRKAWKEWWSEARDKWPGNCLGIDPGLAEQMLVDRRPLRFEEILQVYYGFDEITRSVILWPGTNVCATDVPYRAIGANARFSSAGESCATAISDGKGGTVFSPAAIPLRNISSLDTSARVVHSIASWAEMPHQGLVGHQFLLRYPKDLPTTPNAMPLPTDPNGTNAGHVPLLIAIDARIEGSINRALRCVQADDNEIGDLCGKKGFEATSCGGTFLPSDPHGDLKDSPPKCFRFGERGVITPRITVSINGALLEFPLGTNIRTALERLAPPFPREVLSIYPLSVGQVPDQAVMFSIRLTRLFEGKQVRVDLSDAGASALDLVLLPGDQLSW